VLLVAAVALVWCLPYAAAATATAIPPPLKGQENSTVIFKPPHGVRHTRVF
jgi:hypothetical protein